MKDWNNFANSAFRIPTSIAAVSLLLLLAVLIAACGDDADEETPAPTAAPTATAAPAPAATMAPTTAAPTPAPTMAERVPVEARLITANPVDGEQYTIPYPGSQVSWAKMPEYEHLIGHDIRSNEELPELALAWDSGTDGKTWTFELREGVPFYKDGEPYKDFTFSAKDLTMTWDLLIGDTGNFPTKLTRSPGRWHGLLGDPEDWEVVNDYKVIAHTPNVNLELPFNVSDVWESGILSRDHWDEVGGEEGYQADPIGSGPWTYVSHQVDQSYLHERVDGHWRKTPEFHELEYLQIQEPATRLAMLFSKEAHIIPLVADQREQILGGGYSISKATLPSVNQAIAFIYYREMNYVDPDTGEPPPNGREKGSPEGYDPDDPIRNPQVRLALNYAVDRNELNEVFYNGEAFPLVDEYPTWRSDWQDRWAPVPGPDGRTGKDGGWPYPYDPEAAKQMLADAGFEDGFETRINCLRTHRVIPDWPSMCEQIIQYFAAVGVTAKLEIDQNFGEFRAKAQSGKDSSWMYGASPGYSPICNRIQFGFPHDSGVGYREFEEVDTLQEVCRTATSVEERDAGAIVFGDAWHDKAFTIPLVWVFSQVAYNPDILEDYTVNFSNFGTYRYHEYTVPVYQ